MAPGAAQGLPLSARAMPQQDTEEQQCHLERLCPSLRLPAGSPRGPSSPPYLPAARHGHPPARAAPAPPRAAAPPEAPWKRLVPAPGAATERERCLRGGPGGSGVPELCHAPAPPGGGSGRRWLLLRPRHRGRTRWEAREHRDEELWAWEPGRGCAEGQTLL